VANFVERISVIVDTKMDAASSGFKKLSADVKAADGLTGKFKAGFAGVASSVKANAGTLAAGAGAALLTFAAKAVTAFTETAKAAIDLSNATGLSVEQASRWIAVGDDFGVTADQLATAMGKIGKDLDSAKWEKYGIATRDASGEARSANSIFMDVLETLNNTKPAERARVGAELLGRGWQAVAPILGKTRAEYEAMLAEVEEGQVITKSEAAKAEKWRLAMDKLGDAIRDISLAVGEQVAELAPYIVKLAEVVALLAELKPSADIPKIGDHLRDMAAAAEDSGDAIAFLVEKGYSVKAAEMLMADYRAEVEAAEAPMDKLKSAAEAAEEAQRGLAAGAAAAREHLKELRDEVEDSIDNQYDLEEATLAGDQAYRNYLTSVEEATEAAKDANLTDRERADIMADLQGQQIDVVEGALAQARAYSKEQGAADGSRAAAALQVLKLEEMKKKYPELASEIQRYIDKLKSIPGAITTSVGVKYGPSSKAGSKYASGTSSAKRGVALVGEQGPELLWMDGGEAVTPNGPTMRALNGGGSSLGGATTVNINVTVGPGSNPVDVGRAIVDAQKAYFDSGGARP
jgi:hypothetical protein